MKFKKISLIAILMCFFMLFAACGGNGGKPSEKPDDPTPPATNQSLILSAENTVNKASAAFTAAYNKIGIVLNADVIDSDVYDTVIYSAGYDDNVEYLINLKAEAKGGWLVNRTYHFIVTADGDTVLQKAATENTFGDNYDRSIQCVYGENFRYSAEKTDTGYKTSVLLGYDLLGTTEAEAKGMLAICPAIRNTHDYSDTVWAAYRGAGCNWSDASTFVGIDNDGKFETSEGQKLDVLYAGDDFLEPSNWLTYRDDNDDYDEINLAAADTTASYWKANLAAISMYDAKNVVIGLGQIELQNGKSAADTAKGIVDFIDEIHSVMPNTNILYVSMLPFSNVDAAKVAQVNVAVKEHNGKAAYAVFVDLAAAVLQDGKLTGFTTADGKKMNQPGYNLLNKMLRKEMGSISASAGAFGDGATFASSVNVSMESDGTVNLKGIHDQYTYFKGCGANNFYAETGLNAAEVLNKDAYPKFGLVVSTRNATIFFYIDGGNNLTAQKVGYVTYKANHTWEWSSSIEKNLSLSYSGDKYAKLSVLKYENFSFFL